MMRGLHITFDPSYPTIRLSAFLAECDATELQLFFEEYEYGLSSVLEAVPIQGETFTVMITNLSGYTQAFVMPEEAIRDTPAARKWRDQKVEQARRIICKNTGKVTAEASVLTDSSRDFHRLALIRRLQILRRDPRSRPLMTVHVPKTGVPKRDPVISELKKIVPPTKGILEATMKGKNDTQRDLLNNRDEEFLDALGLNE